MRPDKIRVYSCPSLSAIVNTRAEQRLKARFLSGEPSVSVLPRDPKDDLITRHSSILEVRKIDVLTLSTDVGQDDTGPAILKRSGKINVLTLSTDEGQDGTGPAILKRSGKINVLTLSTDEGQDDTDPAILKR
ncbi:hypothetical protein GQ457_03G021950 [Hibiscus cannabinus]